MNFFTSIIGVLLGFFFLIKGADVFVDGASKIAKKFGIPSIIIGLTIVAVGTSLPEMMVSLASSLAGKNDMCIANVTGSNLFNICMVLALSAIIMKTKYSETISFKEKANSFFRVLFLIDGDTTSRFILIANAILLGGAIIDGQVGRFDGLLLVAGLIAYIVTIIKTTNTSESNKDDESSDSPMFKQIVLMILGAIGIMIGGNLVVDNATNIGTIVGLSENVIGLTIVAMGTSLPELVTSLVAIKKGEADIALGNALGSNILNILLVIGISSIIAPITVTSLAVTDMILAFIITIFVTTTLIKRNNVLSKNLGIIYVLIYLSYTAYAIIR